MILKSTTATAATIAATIKDRAAAITHFAGSTKGLEKQPGQDDFGLVRRIASGDHHDRGEGVERTD